MDNYLNYNLIILLFLLFLGVISKNLNFVLAILFLLILKIISINSVFYWIEKYSFSIGILILTIGVINPIASEQLTYKNIIDSLLNWKSLLAIIIGIFVSWLGHKGSCLISHNPSIVTGLLIGTLIGVSVFKGIPVGPLIAAGMLSLIIGKNY